MRGSIPSACADLCCQFVATWPFGERALTTAKPKFWSHELQELTRLDVSTAQNALYILGSIDLHSDTSTIDVSLADDTTQLDLALRQRGEVKLMAPLKMLVIPVLVSLLPSGSSAQVEDDLRARRAVAHVSIQFYGEDSSPLPALLEGHGVFVTPYGYILTAAHVALPTCSQISHVAKDFSVSLKHWDPETDRWVNVEDFYSVPANRWEAMILLHPSAKPSAIETGFGRSLPCLSSFPLAGADVAVVRIPLKGNVSYLDIAGPEDIPDFFESRWLRLNLRVFSDYEGRGVKPMMVEQRSIPSPQVLTSLDPVRFHGGVSGSPLIATSETDIPHVLGVAVVEEPTDYIREVSVAFVNGILLNTTLIDAEDHGVFTACVDGVPSPLLGKYASFLSGRGVGLTQNYTGPLSRITKSDFVVMFSGENYFGQLMRCLRHNLWLRTADDLRRTRSLAKRYQIADNLLRREDVKGSDTDPFVADLLHDTYMAQVDPVAVIDGLALRSHEFRSISNSVWSLRSGIRERLKGRDVEMHYLEPERFWSLSAQPPETLGTLGSIQSETYKALADGEQRGLALRFIDLAPSIGRVPR